MSDKKEDCFVIMPISDCEGYNQGHFSRVYEDIIKPSVFNADFNPVRGDEVSKTNLIQLDILNKLLEAPIAICDLSSRNPNVLFELGIRQAFDKPVVLIQEKGTPKIFDINPLRYIEYAKEMGYRDVIDAQLKITTSLTETYQAKDEVGNVNSIVKLLALNSAASIPSVNGDGDSLKLNLILSQIAELRDKINPRNSSQINDELTDLELYKLKIKNLADEFQALTEKYSDKQKDSHYLQEIRELNHKLVIARDQFGIRTKAFSELREMLRVEYDNVKASL